MKAPQKEDGNRSSKQNSKYAAIFFISLAALILVLILAIWLVDQRFHVLTVRP